MREASSWMTKPARRLSCASWGLWAARLQAWTPLILLISGGCSLRSSAHVLRMARWRFAFMLASLADGLWLPPRCRLCVSWNGASRPRFALLGAWGGDVPQVFLRERG